MDALIRDLSPGPAAELVLGHLGALHPVETLAMTLLALGPFVIIAVVVAVVSRRDRRQEAQATRAEPERRDDAGSSTTDTAAPQSVQQ